MESLTQIEAVLKALPANEEDAVDCVFVASAAPVVNNVKTVLSYLWARGRIQRTEKKNSNLWHYYVNPAGVAIGEKHIQKPHVPRINSLANFTDW